jgi:hypothetical protein
VRSLLAGCPAVASASLCGVVGKSQIREKAGGGGKEEKMPCAAPSLRLDWVGRVARTAAVLHPPGFAVPAPILWCTAVPRAAPAPGDLAGRPDLAQIDLPSLRFISEHGACCFAPGCCIHYSRRFHQLGLGNYGHSLLLLRLILGAYQSVLGKLISILVPCTVSTKQPPTVLEKEKSYQYERLDMMRHIWFGPHRICLASVPGHRFRTRES